MRLQTLIALSSLWLAVATPAGAELVLYEPFSYGTSDLALGAVDGSALGLDGTTYSTAGTVKYLAAGLSFGDLSVGGGTARIEYHSSEARNATRGLDLSVSSGTLYGSYLYRNYGAANNGVSALLLTSSASHGDTLAKLDIAGNEYDGTSAAAANYAGVRAAGGGAAKATGTQMDGTGTSVYLILFEVTNIGGTTGTQTANLWVLTDSQFATLKAGGITSGELASAIASNGTGSAANQVLQTASFDNAGPNYLSLGSTDFLRLFSSRGNGSFDEIRLSNSSLDEVTPVPEPAGLAGIAMLGQALLRRRRTRRLGRGA
jgi:hypothetical protein